MQCCTRQTHSLDINKLVIEDEDLLLMEIVGLLINGGRFNAI